MSEKKKVSREEYGSILDEALDKDDKRHKKVGESKKSFAETHKFFKELPFFLLAILTLINALTYIYLTMLANNEKSIPVVQIEQELNQFLADRSDEIHPLGRAVLEVATGKPGAEKRQREALGDLKTKLDAGKPPVDH